MKNIHYIYLFLLAYFNSKVPYLPCSRIVSNKKANQSFFILLLVVASVFSHVENRSKPESNRKCAAAKPEISRNRAECGRAVESV